MLTRNSAQRLVDDYVRRHGQTQTDQQGGRKRRLPPQPAPLIKAVTVKAISPDSVGDVTIWRNGEAPTEVVEAALNWMHGGQEVSEGKHVCIQYFDDEDQYVILLAECE